MFFLVAFIVLGVLVAAALYVFWVEPLGMLGLLERMTPNLMYRVQTQLPLVALSFDDGPHSTFTPQVLEVLERYGAKATFFLIGERALPHPEIVAQIRASGHEIGNHYFQNGPTLLHSDTEFVHKLEEAERVLGLAGRLKFFRPPGGWRGLANFNWRGYTGTLASWAALILTIRGGPQSGTSGGSLKRILRPERL